MKKENLMYILTIIILIICIITIALLYNDLYLDTYLYEYIIAGTSIIFLWLLVLIFKEASKN